MHSTRFAAFLLGAWLACSLLLDGGAAQNASHVDDFLRAPIPGAAEIIQTTGVEQAQLLLRHYGAEQNRSSFHLWEIIQIFIALLLAGVIFFATERHPLPQILIGLMLALVLVEYFAITPELSYQGRNLDFPSETAARPSVRDLPPPGPAQVQTLAMLFAGTEAAKLLTGATLASYLFYYRSRKRRRRDDEATEIAKAAALRSGSVLPG